MKGYCDMQATHTSLNYRGVTMAVKR